MRHWNWTGMIEANRGRLSGLLAGLFVLLGAGATVKRIVWREILSDLVPMESALRRLIFAMALEMRVALRTGSAFPGAVAPSGGGERVPVFRLTDRPRLADPPKRKSAPGTGPRVRFADEGMASPERPVPGNDDPMDAEGLRRRLLAMKAALEDLPAQAKRLARWNARRDRKRAMGKAARPYPIRSGRAPGHREGGKGEADEVLADCHDLALRAREMVER